MKHQLQKLLKLQELDLEGDEINNSRQAISNNLEDAKRVLGQLRADLEAQNLELEETIKLHKEKKNEHKEAEDRYKKSKGRLSKVSNTKEYSAIELELENIKRQTAQLEEELLQLIEAIEMSRGTTAEKQAKIEALTQQIEAEKDEGTSKISELESRLSKLTSGRDSLSSDISKRILRQYDFIRSRRGGVAIVAADNGCCQGCFMQLPPQLYIELQRGNTLNACPSCQRILFFDDGEDVE